MTNIDPSLIETLLNMSESSVLDFKRDQYPFAGATEDQRGEIVKDIVAFANAWKTDDAHIFLGANENPGGRAIVNGIAGHINDADLQQLVNSKTNVPVSFDYIPLTVDEKSAAVIRISREQQRPIYLKKKFGKLLPNVVYIRRGSSTDDADPDEIARMGASAITARQVPVLDLQLAEPSSRSLFGRVATVSSKVLRERPPVHPDLLAFRYDVLRMKMRFIDEPDSMELVAYTKECGLLRPLGFYAKNVGSVVVDDVRVVLTVPREDGLRLVESPPPPPTGPMLIGSFASPRSSRSISIDSVRDTLQLEARLGKIQPGAEAWSRSFWIGCDVPKALNLVACLYGDNIPASEVPIEIKIEATEGYIDGDQDDD